MAENKDRVILHVDCNAYYASVEELIEPELKKVPMAICGNPENRHGIILAKNELAKGYGVKTAETIWQAKKKCPDLVLRSPRRKLYSEYCEKINAIYESYTDQIERAGQDESYLDCTRFMEPYNGDVRALGNDIRARIPEQTGLTVSVGISWNKAYAKLGSDYEKPNGLTIIDRGNYKDIVWPLPASALLFVGKSTNESLKRLGITSIGDLARADENMLVSHFGKMGHQLHIYANGLDGDPVKMAGEREELQSVGNGITFKRDLTARDEIQTALTALSDEVAGRMRRQGVKCNTVQVTIKDTSLKVITRQKQTDEPTFLASDLSKLSMQIFENNWQLGKPVRMLTVTAMKLVPEGEAVIAEQLSLFDSPQKKRNSKKRENLEKTVDKIRDKYGDGIIKPASVHKNDLGIYEGEQSKESSDEKS